jgi:hypothetical protein
MCFQDKECNKHNWAAKNHQSIIGDRIVINKLTKCVLETRVFRRFELETNHFLFVSTRRFPRRWLRSKAQGKMTQKENFKASILKDAIIRWLFQQTEKVITQNLEIGNSKEQKWLNICKIFKQIALESLGKRKNGTGREK